jgi:uncharacterized RDD family membrane protein YckC
MFRKNSSPFSLFRPACVPMALGLLALGLVIQTGWAQEAEKKSGSKTEVATEPAAAPVPPPATVAEPAEEAPRENHDDRRHSRHREIVEFGKDVVLKKGEECREMVVIQGHAQIDGVVDNDVVVVGGSATVNGRINGELVVILGSVKLGPSAEVRRDIVVIGGPVDRDPNAKLGGDQVIIGTGGRIFGLSGIFDWLSNGLLWARPLPHNLGWAWVMAAIFLVVNILLAIMFPRSIESCYKTMEDTPVAAFFTGMLAMILMGPLLVLLVVTVVGVLVVPFVLCALVLALIFGKIALYQYVGTQTGRQVHLGILQAPVVAITTGTMIFYVLYTIPVIGFMVWGLLTVMGLGAAVKAAAGTFRREYAPVSNGVALPAFPPPPADPGSPAAVAYEASLSRAGFWRRTGATLLDMVLFFPFVFFVAHAHVFPPVALVAWIAYHIVMWMLKGATIGGIVAGIKVVRMDGRPMDFAVSLVRSLSSIFSALALLIGFFWVGWTREKRSWHDIIAGTTIVVVPRGMSLI